MGRIKEWLMTMEEDAHYLSNSEFVNKYGKGNERIWHQINCPGFSNYFVFYNTENEIASEDHITIEDELLKTG